MAKRGEHCYLCGKKFQDNNVIKTMLLDGRERRVDSTCKNRKEKAMKDLARFT